MASQVGAAVGDLACVGRNIRFGLCGGPLARKQNRRSSGVTWNMDVRFPGFVVGGAAESHALVGLCAPPTLTREAMRIRFGRVVKRLEALMPTIAACSLDCCADLGTQF